MHQNNKNKKAGFTIIELLVVISIIGLLSSIVLVSLNTSRTKAKYAKVQIELDQFLKAAVIAQGESAKPLKDITGSNCSDCVCRGSDMRNISASSDCYTQWVNGLTTIQNATAGAISGLNLMTRDPWGSPYALDENERESGASDCRLDVVRSVGPNGIYGDGDDQYYFIPPSRPCP